LDRIPETFWQTDRRVFGILFLAKQKKKDKVNKAIGKYLGLTFRAGIRISFDLLKEIYRKAPSVLEEAYKKK